MTKLTVTIPTGEKTVLADNVDVHKATELAVEYVHKYDLHNDNIDITFVDESGEPHEFDFDAELFRP